MRLQGSGFVQNLKKREVSQDYLAHCVDSVDFSNVPVPKWPLTCPVMPVILNSDDALLVRLYIAKFVQVK